MNITEKPASQTAQPPPSSGLRSFLPLGLILLFVIILNYLPVTPRWGTLTSPWINLFGNGNSKIVGHWMGGQNMVIAVDFATNGTFTAHITGTPENLRMPQMISDGGSYTLDASKLTMTGRRLKVGRYDSTTEMLYIVSDVETNTGPVELPFRKIGARLQAPAVSAVEPLPESTFAKKWVFRRSYSPDNLALIRADIWSIDWILDMQQDGSYASLNRTQRTSQTGTWSLQRGAPSPDPTTNSLFNFKDRSGRWPTHIDLNVILIDRKTGEKDTLRIAEYLDQPYSVPVYGMRLQDVSHPAQIMEFYPADTPMDLLKPTREPQ